MNQYLSSGRVGRMGVSVHRMLQTRARVVVEDVRQHDPDLPRVFVGNGDAPLHASIANSVPAGS